MGSGGGGSGTLRALLGGIVLVGVILFLFAGVLRNQVTTTTRTRSTTSQTKNSKNWNFVAEERHPSRRGLDHLNYVSKRRVPNGPDPIHNRRAVKFRQPPGRI